MNKTYVSLDLETTGLRPESDEIIEIACVKFQGEEILDTFHSLVNPHHPLPYRIQVLCGLSQAEIDAAPSFTALAGDLISFLQGYPIVGHNISFDLSFLAQKGIRPTNAVYDTHELATLLLFQLPDYSLHSMAQHLGLPTPTHRALPDATTTKCLFLALLDRACLLDLSTLEEIVRLAEKADWELGDFFREATRLKAKATFSTGLKTKDGYAGGELQRTENEPQLTPRPHKVPLDMGKLSDIPEVEAILARALPSYERRQEQMRMMQAVAQALNDGEHLIVEAGTGTGKSIAYLLPSILFASQSGVPIVISTNTINLQEQLIGKDIPDLLQALEQHGDELRAVQVKGRANYLCLRRLAAMEASDRLTQEEAKFLVRIKAWLQSTDSGDRAELNLSGSTIPIWNRLCAQVEERLEAQCSYHQRDACFLYRARKAAESAHLIVVNHALLLADLISETKILPEYNHLIIDEAHHLEEEATRQLGYQVMQWDLLDYLNRFGQGVRGQGWAGLLSQLEGCFRNSALALSRRRQLEQLTEVLGNRVERARARVSQFFDKLREFVERQARDYSEYDRHLRLTAADRAQPGWSRVESAWEDLNLALEGLGEDINRLYLGLEDLGESKASDYNHLMTDLSSLFQRNRELRQQIDSLVSRPEQDNIYWLTISGQTNMVSMSAAPLSVDWFLGKSLFSLKDCVILTGATLSTEGTFEYIKGRLGLECVNELLLGAPFDYLSSAMLYIPRDIPEPGNQGYQQAVEKALVALCRASRGRTLVLFTSHAGLRATQAAIQAPLEEDGILVLGQGVNGSARQLLTALKSNPETVILGTASLWEGIDVVGETLSVLVMARLPFNVPTEPIFAARAELFDDPFNEYAIPQAVLRFKQGFGRLIRSKNDRGAMVVLDSRLCTRQYGSAFLDSIPLCTVIRGSSGNLTAAVSGWLNKDAKMSTNKLYGEISPQR